MVHLHPKIPIREYFGRPWHVKYGYIFKPFGIFMVTVIANWFILRQFCTFMYFIFFGTLCQQKSGNTGQMYIDGLSMDEVSFAQGLVRQGVEIVQLFADYFFICHRVKDKKD
jgi:hypothetical protein